MRLLALAALAAFALPVSSPAVAAQTGPVTSADSTRTLYVNGNGEVRAVPDRAVIRIGLKSDGETVEEALQNHAAELERVEALLVAADIPDDERRVTKSAVSKDQDQYGGESEGYAAVSLLSVNVDDLTRVPTLLASIADAEDDLLVTHDRSVDVQYVVRDLEPIRLDALRIAVENATRRATLVAEMSGMRLGIPNNVNESGAQNFGNENNQDSYMGATPSGEIRVVSSVSVTFPLYEAE